MKYKLDFDTFVNVAAILESCNCSHAKRGCDCDGCDECKANQSTDEENEESLDYLLNKYVSHENEEDDDVSNAIQVAELTGEQPPSDPLVNRVRQNALRKLNNINSSLGQP